MPLSWRNGDDALLEHRNVCR